MTAVRSAATVVVLGQMVVAASETALLVVLAIVLLLVNPAVALGAIAFFAFVGFGLQRILGFRAARFAAQRTSADIVSLIALQEAFGTYRELTVGDRRSLYVDRILRLRKDEAKASAGLQLVNILPKYVSEAALVLGAFLLAGVLFATKSASVAVGTFSLFLATATRVMPSLLRLQAAALSVQIASGTACNTFAMAEDLGHPLGVQTASAVHEKLRRALSEGHPDFVPTIEMCDVSFTYPGSDTLAVKHLNLSVGRGQSVALVGPSGAGKSTLADLILGVLDPHLGNVEVGGLKPGEAVQRWPGSIAYVPQDVLLADDTVRANVALGLPAELIDDELVWAALDRAQLGDYLRTRPEGLDAQVGERGLRLSGGQRQRLGVARALFSRPRLLVLDEATSALDAETEQAVTKMLQEFDGDVTTVIIAHRLSTVRHADVVVYVDDGRAKSMGTFDEVCARVPALQRQAALMGLK